MNIAVIAANGRLGKNFVQEALQKGHHVRAGVRGQHAFVSHPELEIVKCDATDESDVRDLLSGQDVVVSALGHVRHSPPDVQTQATKNIVAAMKEQGILRYVDVTGTGVRFSGDKIPIIDYILNAGIQLIDPARVQDGRNHQEVLKTSDREWTTIRILKLQNNAPRPYNLTTHGPTKWFVGRQEVARAMLEVIEQHSFVGQAPIISRSQSS
jgi:hypothetical protein